MQIVVILLYIYCMETVKEFIDAVKEMRDAQVAYSLFPSGENKRRKENHEKDY